MKCKRLFALLLSLCMILSTFVAVSAEEKEFIKGTDTVTIKYVDVGSDFENGMGHVLATASLSPEIVEIGDGKALRVTYSNAAASSYNNVVGLCAGQKLQLCDLPADATVTWSVDVMIPDKTRASSGYAVFRDGAWTPTGLQKTLGVGFGGASVAGEWKTFGKTSTIAELYPNGPAENTNLNDSTYLVLRELFSAGEGTATMYFDNFRLTVSREVYGEKLAEVGNDFNTNIDGLAKGDASLTIAKANVGGLDVAKVSGNVVSGATYKELAGFQIDGDVQDIAAANPNARLYYRASIMMPDTTVANPFLFFRKGQIKADGSAAPTGAVADIVSTMSFTNNVWTTVSGDIALSDLTWGSGDSAYTAYAFRMQFKKAGDIYIDEMSAVIYNPTSAEDAIPDKWVDPDYDVDFTLASASSSAVVDGGSVTIKLADVMTAYEANPQGVNDTTVYFRVNPAKDMPKAADFTLTYDVTVSGGMPGNGSTKTGVRLLSSLSQASMGYTFYFARKTVSTADGTVTLALTPADADRTDGTSTADSILSYGICYSFSDACKNYNAATDSDVEVTFSNFNLEYNSKVVATAAKSADAKSVTLTLANPNARTYKVAGNLFVAAYAGNEMLKFGKAVVNEEIAAGDSTEVSVDFNEALEGTVRVFFWEADGSLTPIKDFTL